MFRNFIAWLASKLREAFDWFPGAAWRFIKNVPHWLDKGAVFLQTRVADLLPPVTLFTTSAILRKFAGRAGENLPRISWLKPPRWSRRFSKKRSA
jgi:hypothetical protein